MRLSKTMINTQQLLFKGFAWIDNYNQINSFKKGTLYSIQNDEKVIAHDEPGDV